MMLTSHGPYSPRGRDTWIESLEVLVMQGCKVWRAWSDRAYATPSPRRRSIIQYLPFTSYYSGILLSILTVNLIKPERLVF